MEKPERELTDMPNHIKQMITNLATTDMATKLSLGLVSHEFRDYVEGSTNYSSVFIDFFSDKVMVDLSVTFEKPRWSEYSKRIEFHPHENGCMKKNTTSNWEQFIPEMDYKKAAIHYTLAALGRLVTTDCFYIGMTNEAPRIVEDRSFILDEMEQFLKELGRKLNVKRLVCSLLPTDAQILQLFSFFKPGKVSEIDFKGSYPANPHPPLNLNLISETEHWKQAKTLKISGYDISKSFEKLTDFEEVEIDTRALPVASKTIVETFMTHPTMKSLIVQCNDDIELTGVDEYLDQFGGEEFHGYRGVVLQRFFELNTEIELAFRTNRMHLARYPTNPNQPQ